ncbi:MAG TPA: polysaccharide deacetylase family protein [Vicinamibacterales bacterium]|nr:polysaccharide deacetylase family protein [Vicinamibacterales bacterium]
MAAVLLYHRVADAAVDPFGLCVSAGTFRRHMETIARSYRPLPLAAFVADAIRRRLEPESVAVTFDDGYLDNLTTAQPILEEFGIPASFFITTSTLQSGAPYWWDQLVHIVFGATRKPSTLAQDPHELLRVLHRPLMRATVAERDRELQRLTIQLGPPDPRTLPRPMNKEEVRELANRPAVTIGAHGVSHTALPALTAAEQMAELTESRRHLEDLVRLPVTSVAYPFGEATDTTVAVAHQAGFRIGAVVGNRACQLPLDRLRVPRIEVDPLTDIDARLAVDCAHESSTSD